MIQKLKLLLKRALSYIPTRLPVGMAEFENWSEEVIELSGAFADRTSMKFALASMILHAEHSASVLSKNYFVRRLRKSAANQVASQVFQDIKQKQEAAQLAAKAEETAPKAVNETKE
jgi:hypothetical protein